MLECLDLLKVLQGNTDYVNSESRILDPPIIARFIKINVKTYSGYPSLRVELYGCTEGMRNIAANFLLSSLLRLLANIVCHCIETAMIAM